MSIFKNHWTKWALLETFYFDCSWYVVQVKQCTKTGYKKFRCRKIIGYEYGKANISVENINKVLSNEQN